MTISIDAAQILIEDVNTDAYIIETETGMADRRMLLSIQNMVRQNASSYTYIETGSYMGGTLAPHLLDRRCSCVMSVDKRPDIQPDERSCSFDYTRSSTRLMLERLEKSLPFSTLLKLRTFDMDASELPSAIPYFDLGFIDGEHTNRAAFQDFLSIYRFAKQNCVISFHDANLVTDAIANVEAFLTWQKVTFQSLVLPDVLYSIFIGEYAGLAAGLRRFSSPKEEYFASCKEALWRSIAATRAHAA